jgi:hypothetical protein
MLRERIPLVNVFDLILLENLESVKVCWHVINNMIEITATFSILHRLDFFKYCVLRMGRYSQSLDSDREWLFLSDAPEWVPPHPFT